MSTSDQQVVERVRAGDTEAFSDLVARHQKATFGIAVSTTADVDEAEDLVQICFVEAFSRLGELRDGCRFGPWLYSIARNRCRNWLRDRSRLPIPASDPSGLRPADDPELSTNPEQDVLDRAWSDAVGPAIAALPSDYREIVILRYVADLSYEEIGQALSLGASTARSRCRRARDMMRESSCKQIEELIHKRLDDELTIDEEDRLEQHLAICPDCRDRWQQAEALVRDLRAAFQPSDVLTERVMNAVRTAVFCARRAAHLGDEQAASTYRELARRAADTAQALACEERPEVYLLLGGEYYLPRQEWGPMKQAFRRALELDPVGSAGSVEGAALALADAGHSLRAMDVLCMVLSLEPEVAGPEPLHHAVVHFERGIPAPWVAERALMLLTPLLDQVEDDSFVLAAMADAHLRTGQAERALKELDAATSGAAATTACFWHVKAHAEEAAGHEDQAVAAAIKCVEMTPGGNVEYSIVMVLARLDPAAGAQAFRRRIAAGESERHDWWSILLEHAGDPEGAEAAAVEFARAQYGSTFIVLSDFCRRHRRWLDEEKALRKAVQACPPGDMWHARHQGFLAKVLLAQAKWNEAIEHAVLSLRALEGAHDVRGGLWQSLAVFYAVLALDHGPTAEQAAEMRDAVLLCLRAIDRDVVGPPDTWPEWLLAHVVDGLGATGERGERVEYWLRILELSGRIGATGRAWVQAARSLSSLAPEQARQHFDKMAAEEPTSDLPWLRLCWVEAERSPRAAVDAALEAVARARIGAPPEAYEDVADLLAKTDPIAGLEAFAGRADEVGGVAGPLTLGLTRLAVAAEDWDRLRTALDSILASDDGKLAEQAACLLSGLGRHAEAVELMEHAVRGNVLPRLPTATAHRIFAEAGEGPRAAALYDELASEWPPDHWRAFDAGDVHMYEGNRDRSKYWFERAEALLPGTPFVPLHLARWYLLGGDLDQARQHYELARAAGPWAANALARLDALADATDPVTSLCDWVREELRPEAAGEVLEAALAASEAGRALAAVAEGLHALAEQGPDRVLDWARRLADRHPDNLTALLAREALEGGSPPSEERIARALEQIIYAAPSWGESVGAAVTYFVENDPHAGLGALQPLLERSPDASEVHRDLGRLLEAAGELQQAQAEYLKAAELSGWRDGSSIAFYAQHGQADEALAAADRALGAHPKGSAGHAHLTLTRAEALQSLGMAEEAATAAREAIAAARDPDAECRAEVFLRCGQLLLDQDLASEAADALRRTLELASIRRSQRAEAEAGLKAAADRALALHPEGIASHADALCEEAEELQAAGDQHAAVECARTVPAYAHLERSADAGAVALRAAGVLQEAGEFEEAARACLMAMERWAGPPAREAAVEIAQAAGDEAGDSVRRAVEEVVRLARTWDDTLKGAMSYLLEADRSAYCDVANLLRRTGPEAGEETFGDRLGKTRWPDPRLTMALIWLAAEVEDWDELGSVVGVLLESNDADVLEEAAESLSGLGRHGEAAALGGRAVSLGSGEGEDAR